MKFEGALLRDPDPFSYFMLIAFEGSGLIRFVFLLLTWPLVQLLRQLNMPEAALKLTIFVSLAGLHKSEILSVSRAVLPKFFMDDIDMDAWEIFDSSLHPHRAISTEMPTIMVERFAKEHLLANHVIGTELLFNRFGFSTGFTINQSRKETHPLPPPSNSKTVKMGIRDDSNQQQRKPLPVIFHDGRLVRRPTPTTALKIIFWIPVGILLAVIRITIGVFLPLRLIPHVSPLFGGKVIVRGKPPAASGDGSGVLFVCTHRTLMDPVVLSSVLRRRIPAVTYSISIVSEILSPIRTVRLTRVRHLDAEKIKQELEKGDLVVCPEGTTCREPFLLRFSAMFAELTDRIVPVGMNYKVGLFHATTARGWKGLDPVFFFMNPNPVYEVTFLNQLPAEATCGAGKSPHDVANYVQKMLAATLGFEATNFTRKDKYRLLAGNDGVVAAGNSYGTLAKKVVGALKPFIQE